MMQHWVSRGQAGILLCTNAILLQCMHHNHQFSLMVLHEVIMSATLAQGLASCLTLHSPWDFSTMCVRQNLEETMALTDYNMWEGWLWSSSAARQRATPSTARPP